MTRLLTILAALALATPLRAADEKVTYDDHVKTIFRARCFACHNPDKKSGDLDMTNYTSLLQGGGSGEVVEPGDPDASYLWLVVSHESEPYMPPNSERIPDAELAVIRAWITGGLLENSGSKAMKSSKPKYDLALAGAPTGRPETPPMPWRLSIDPVLHTEQTDAITSIAANPWSSLVAVAGQHQVLLYDAADGELLGVLPFPEGRAQVLRFSRNGSLLLAAGGQGASSGRAVLWNVRTGERVAEVGDELDEVLAADVSADQQLVALGGPNKIVRVYSIATGEVLYSLTKHTDWIHAIEFSPDGVLLATADRSSGVHVWEGHTGREYLTLTGHKGAVNAVSWRVDGNLLATGSEDGTIKLWEMNDGKEVKSWTGHAGGVADVEFARDGKLVSCGRDKTAKLWDQAGKQLRAFPAFQDIALRVAHSAETNHVVAGDWTGKVRMWKADDGAAVAELSVNPPKLDTLVKSAEASLAATNTEFTKLDTAAKASEAENAKQKAALAAANQAIVAATKAMTDAANAANAAKQEAAKQTAAKDAATKRMAALTPVVTLLTEASAKLAEVSGKAPADAALKSLAAEGKKQLDAKTAELATAKKALETATAALKVANDKLTAATTAANAAKTKLEAAKKEVERLTPIVKSTGEKATVARNAANAAAGRRTAAERELARARESVVFTERLRQLREKRAARLPLANAVADAEAKVTAATRKVAAVKSQLADAGKKKAEADAAVKTVGAQITKTTGERDAYTKQATTLQPVVVALTASVAKAKEAATKLPGDEALKKAVAALEAERAAKAKAETSAKQAAAAKATELAKQQQQLAASQQRVAETTKTMQAAQTAVNTANAEMQAVAQVLGKARAELAQFDTGLKQIEDQVRAMRTEAPTGAATAAN